MCLHNKAEELLHVALSSALQLKEKYVVLIMVTVESIYGFLMLLQLISLNFHIQLPLRRGVGYALYASFFFEIHYMLVW